MKLECDVEKLKNAILKTERVTGKNLSLPILNSILLIASEKNLKLRATNLSLGIEIEIPAKVYKEGVSASSGDVLSNFFANIYKDETALLELKSGNLSIKTKNNAALIKNYSHEDFPTLPIVKENLFKIDAEKLLDGIKSVYFSAALSDIKPEFASVYVFTDRDDLIFVATDSFRLAEKKIKLKNVIGAGLSASIIFFLVSNFGVWLGSPMYPQNISGLITCYITGIPFFGNTIGGDLFYSAVLFGTFELAKYKFPKLAMV